MSKGDGIMSDYLLEKIVQKCEEREKNYIKARNDDMFEWFDEVAKPILELYLDENDIFYCESDDDGITVEIETEEYLMLPYIEKEVMEVLEMVDTCIIKPMQDNKIKIHLWFRGWEWVKKNL